MEWRDDELEVGGDADADALGLLARAEIADGVTDAAVSVFGKFASSEVAAAGDDRVATFADWTDRMLGKAWSRIPEKAGCAAAGSCASD
jgi:hypothetical protein